MFDSTCPIPLRRKRCDRDAALQSWQNETRCRQASAQDSSQWSRWLDAYCRAVKVPTKIAEDLAAPVYRCLTNASGRREPS